MLAVLGAVVLCFRKPVDAGEMVRFLTFSVELSMCVYVYVGVLGCGGGDEDSGGMGLGEKEGRTCCADGYGYGDCRRGSRACSRRSRRW